MQTTSTPSSSPGKKRILILDDDKLIGETLGNYINSLGEEYRCTTTLDDFYVLLDQWQPDIVLIDLQLQGTDGLAAFRELALRKSQALIIVMSGLGHKILDSATETALQRGLNVIGNLNKPFRLAELKTLLERALPLAVKKQDTTDQAISPEDLKHALAHKHLCFMVQPKFSSRTGTLTGFEVLARWYHDRLGTIAPDRFIAMAESHGLIDDLTKGIFEQAASWFSTFLRSLKRHRETYHLAETLTLAVNLSARSLANEALFEWLYACCDQYALSANRVVFELTETSAMQDVAASLDNLTRIRLRGFSLSLDDFGCGYSSLQQLVRLPFSEIKIDKSFVISSEHSRDATAVIQAAVSLAASMGMRVIAEGVENRQTLELVSALGCDLIQGYFTGRPMSPDAVEAWLHERESERRNLQIAKATEVNQIDFSDNHKIIKIAQLLAGALNVPTVLVTSVDAFAQKSLFKLQFQETDIVREESFCAIAIKADGLFVVEDASQHEMFRDNPLVTGNPGIRFYAGQPYLLEDGMMIGALCAIDYRPRSLDSINHRALTVLADCLGREVSRASEKGYRVRPKFSDVRIRRFREQASVLWEYGSRMQLGLGMIIFKLAGLETANLSHGREMGNQLIQQFNDALLTECRTTEVAGRYRGAYFAVLTTTQGITQGTPQLNERAEMLNRQLDAWLSHHSELSHLLSIRISVHVCDEQQYASFESSLEDAIDYLQTT